MRCSAVTPWNGFRANGLHRAWCPRSASRWVSWSSKDWWAPAEPTTSQPSEPNKSEPINPSLPQKDWTSTERPPEISTARERTPRERPPSKKSEQTRDTKRTQVTPRTPTRVPRQERPTSWNDFVISANDEPLSSAPEKANKETWSGSKVVFSAIQPTGVPHLGNYLGALRTWRELQDAEPLDTRLIFSIADLHSLTVPPRQRLGAAARRLRTLKRSTLAALLAIGLDPARCTIFYQSTVPAHSELQWILSCTASMGYLGRMTQWKSKLQVPLQAKGLTEDIKKKLKHGLFSYPILQAADVLVHGATHVPVGDDQSQHLEFVRECANNFNHLYGRVLASPETVLAPSHRVMSLQDPTKKMSKSDPNESSRIMLTDDEDVINKKIQMSVTDSTNSVSYDPNLRPGVANLLQLWSAFDPEKRDPMQLTLETEGWNLGWLKKHAAEGIIRGLGDIRERYLDYMSRDEYLDEVLQEGTRKATESAEETMKTVRTAVGLGNEKNKHV